MLATALTGNVTMEANQPLFAATDEANIPDAIASQMADMFSGDVDFHRELKKGDRFSVVYESMTADGEPITDLGRHAGAEDGLPGPPRGPARRFFHQPL